MEQKKLLKPFILCIFWGFLLSKITFEIGFIPQLESIISIGCYFYALRCLKRESTLLRNAYFLSAMMVVYNVFMLFYPYIAPFDVPDGVIYIVVAIKLAMEISILAGIKKYSQKMDLRVTLIVFIILNVMVLVYRGYNGFIVGIFGLCLVGVVLYNIYLCYQDVKENATTITFPHYKIQPGQLFLLLSVIGIVISGVFMYGWPYYQYSYIDNKVYDHNKHYKHLDSYHFETIDQISKKSIIRDVDVYEISNQYIYLFKQRIPLSEKYSFMDCTNYIGGNNDFVFYDVYDENQRYLSIDTTVSGFMFDENYKRTYLNPEAKYIEIINEYTFFKEVEDYEGKFNPPYTEVSLELSLYPYGELYNEENKMGISMIYLIEGTKVTVQQ